MELDQRNPSEDDGYDLRSSERMDTQNDEGSEIGGGRATTSGEICEKALGIKKGEGATELQSMPKSLSEKIGTSVMTNSKFAQMVEDALKDFRLPHYGELSTQTHFEVIKPCLISNKFVAY